MKTNRVVGLVVLLTATVVAEFFLPATVEWFFGAAYLAAFLLGGAIYRRSSFPQDLRGILLAGLLLVLATTVIQGPYVAGGCLVAAYIGVGITYSLWPL